MAVSITVTIPDQYQARVLTALQAIHDQEGGETNKAFVKRLLRGWFRENVLHYETTLLSADVPGDIVDVTG